MIRNVNEHDNDTLLMRLKILLPVLRSVLLKFEWPLSVYLHQSFKSVEKFVVARFSLMKVDRQRPPNIQ